MNDKDEAKQQIDQLRADLERHNHLYYIDAAPTITDREYDQLLQTLDALEKQFPRFGSPIPRPNGSALRRWGRFENVRHPVPMMSLSNTYSKEELVDFDGRIRKLIPEVSVEYILEPKIDGVAISLRYENGELVPSRYSGRWHRRR